MKASRAIPLSVLQCVETVEILAMLVARPYDWCSDDLLYPSKHPTFVYCACLQWLGLGLGFGSGVVVKKLN